MRQSKTNSVSRTFLFDSVREETNKYIDEEKNNISKTMTVAIS